MVAARRITAGASLGVALMAAACVSLIAAPVGRTIAVQLATASGVSAAARAALMTEATRLWSRAGVTIVWVDGGDHATLRLLVVSSHRAAAATSHWAVAELLPGATPMPTAIASLESAWRVVESAVTRVEPDALRQQRLGRVLGRAAAHEIGHHLLGRGHARHGLMRARIAVAEFADLRDGGFEVAGQLDMAAPPVTPAVRLAALPARR